MLPQPRLRFVLADDPGAGKTIMAGLLLKELRLRLVADRVLILCPAPLTSQWQDELHDKFDERFDDRRLAPASNGSSGESPWQRARPMYRIDRLRQARRGAARPAPRRVGSGGHRRGAQVLGRVVSRGGVTAATSSIAPSATRWRRSSAAAAERLLLMTATPHSGDRAASTTSCACWTRTSSPSTTWLQSRSRKTDSPYFLRREKEDLVDEHGASCSSPREVVTQPFELGPAELALYEAVTEYIQHFLGAPPAAAAATRSRSRARSCSAVWPQAWARSAPRCASEPDRIADRLAELEALPPAERAQRLRELRAGRAARRRRAGRRTTPRRTEEDARGRKRGRRRDARADAGRDHRARAAGRPGRPDHRRRRARPSSSRCGTACRRPSSPSCEDGRGKLLIFTEHRDTLDYLERNLREWGYTHLRDPRRPPADRTQAASSRSFSRSKQICIATEAAGEGINLQFCHLMINYDLPWNPVRLEQRMGRIHRIGQEHRLRRLQLLRHEHGRGQAARRACSRSSSAMRTDLGGTRLRRHRRRCSPTAAWTSSGCCATR